ncbi:MAG: hypothetical protein IT327_13175 [Anaerolineae bacterium]|nr:hypothetical protein [Anaerolineae bacterium]
MPADAVNSTSLSPLGNIREASNLTELQLLYWVGHQLRPSAAHFNNAFTFTFTTSLDPHLFQQAFAIAVAEHDVLRTVIHEQDDIPQQQVLDKPPTVLGIVDLSAEPDPTRAAQTWQQQRVQRPFQLTHGLYDAALLKLNETHYLWFFNQHHLITDASSFFLIAETVLANYDALRHGEALPQGQKPAFAQYAATLKRQLGSSRAAKSQTFWQEKVAQKPESLHFYGRSPQKLSNQVRRWIHQLTPDQTAQLIAAAENADLGTATTDLRQFCLTAALFFALIHQLTGSIRLGFVTTIHNRSTQVNRQTVGPVMELCPVLVELDPADSFITVMQKVAAEMRQLLLHYRHGASQAASDLALDLMFSFVPRPQLILDGRIIEHHIVHPGVGSERLALHVHHLESDGSSGRYELYLDLLEDTFNADQQQHANHTLLQLIDTILQNPDLALSQSALPWPVADEPVADDDGRSARPAFSPPQTDLERALQQIWEEVLGIAPIGRDDDFFALGGESWQAMSFLSKFAAATGHYLPLSSLLQGSTIAGLGRQIEAAVPPESLLQIQPGTPDMPPLFLIPGAAGNTLAMDRLGRRMAANQPVYTFQIPDLAEKILAPARVQTFAPYYLEALQALQPAGPYYLFGYSAGGILAYEVAQQLLAQGEEVAFLAILDMPAPNPAYRVWWRLAHLLAWLLRLSPAREETFYLWGRDLWSRLTYWLKRGLRISLRQYGRLAQHIWQMPQSRRWHHLQMWLRRRREVQRAISPPVLRDMDPASITDPRARTLFTIYDRASRSYLPEPYPGRLTLLRCPLGYGRKEIRSPYPHYGWKKLVRHLDTYVINAQGHLALLQEPAVVEVAQKLQAALDEAQNQGKDA